MLNGVGIVLLTLLLPILRLVYKEIVQINQFSPFPEHRAQVYFLLNSAARVCYLTALGTVACKRKQYVPSLAHQNLLQKSSVLSASPRISFSFHAYDPRDECVGGFFSDLFIYMYEGFTCMYVCVPCAYPVLTEVRRWHWIPRNWSCSWL